MAKEFTSGEYRRLTAARDRLLRACVSRGAAYLQGNRSKIYTGTLSPGCLRCSGGTFLCLFLTEKCSRSCFFCLQDRSGPQVREYEAVEIMNGSRFSSPEDCIKHLRCLGYRGVGFSGGEPFLEFEKLLRYVKKIRSALGGGIYIWAYTNGDLSTDKNLRALAAAGLDELRFDLSARNYDLAPVRLAARRVKTVAIEIPAIPEDLNTVVALLPELRSLGVKHLNLHQLRCTRHNFRAFAQRGYAVVRPKASAETSVPESEITALKIIKAALDGGGGLAVNYCSSLYKDRFLTRTGRARLAAYQAGNGGGSPEEGAPTGAGLLRRLYWEGDPRELRAAMRRWNLEAPGSCSLSGSRLFLQPRLLERRELQDKTVTAAYHYVFLKRKGPSGGGPFPGNAPGRPGIVESATLAEVALPDRVSKLLFKGLFLDGLTVEEAAGLAADQAPPGRGRLRSLKASGQFRDKFEDYEFLSGKLPGYSGSAGGINAGV
ncbi:MAG TPA: radical SAM protein [Elusimicrobiales bacterium]|nr:radical SAM protein [Elusimicrobiales bacterium]